MLRILVRGLIAAMLFAGGIALGNTSASTSTSAQTQGAPGTIRLAVDASQAPQKILHVHMQIPVKAGPLTLYYPEWIPGEHMPDGPIIQMAGLKFKAEGKDDCVAARSGGDVFDSFADSGRSELARCGL